MNNKQIYNILSQNLIQKNISKPNIVYEKTGSLLDKAIYQSEKFNFIPKQLYDNSIIYSNAIIINNVLTYTQNTSIYSHFDDHQKLLFFQNKPPNFFKKEDIGILINTIKSCKCIGLTDGAKAWGIKNMLYIPYGVPKNLMKNTLRFKNKDILIYNTKNTNIGTSLYQQIVNSFPSLSIDSLTDDSLSIENQIDIISDYKIVLDTDNTYNQLIALCCGSMVIAGQKNIDNEFLYEYNFSKDILDNIPRLLNLYNKANLEKNAKLLLENYDFTNFENKLLNILL